MSMWLAVGGVTNFIHVRGHSSIMEDEGKFVWRYDAGWDEIKTENKHYDMLRTKLVDKGYLMSWDGNFYVFITGERCWALLASNTGAKNICMLLGIENATTGYVNAMSRYVNWLTKHCGQRLCSIMPRSICIGTRRLEISVEGKTMSFRDCDSLLGDFKFEDPRACQAAIYPGSFVKLPLRWTHPGAGDIESFIYPLFDNDTDIETLKWHIGNSLIDPGGTPKALIMFGPGGTGKSTILGTIMECMQGCCGVLPPGTFTSTATGLADGVKAALVGSRMVICDNVDLDHRPIDVNALKSIVEADYLSDGMNRFKPCCSLILASNGLQTPVSARTR
ncbi:hypothetical protein OCU04_007452 [Sclerotinia nivalis]|uniref:SF3 helicase domain-containing protein n=1 Tax=Sclerotinia nivalis TaxID=352851 RepID=A0A9X0AMA5_9HELO|nr:hypothetical protein OCU04_007452 [Sclerotinia nivalis]